MKQPHSFRGHTGTYVIFHEEAKCAYVGQSTNVGTRIESHFKDLRSGKHHNLRLQAQWIRANGSGFDWRLVEHAPNNLYGLELDRWLADHEDLARLTLGKKYWILNKAPSEVVESIDAVREFKIEVKEINRSITQERTRLTQEMKHQQARVAKITGDITSLQQELSQIKTLIKSTTGLSRRILGLGPNRKGRAALGTLHSLEVEHETLLSLLRCEQSKLDELASRSKALYAQYEGVMRKNHQRRRSIYDRPKPWETSITRRRRKVLYLPDTRCTMHGYLCEPKSVRIEVSVRIGERTTLNHQISQLPWETYCHEVLALRVTNLTETSSAKLSVSYASQLLISEVTVQGSGTTCFHFKDGRFSHLRRSRLA
jgi:hypothetical protein